MKTKIIALHAVAALVVGSVPAFAAPSLFTVATVAPSGRTVRIPERAAEVADNVFDLGTATDPASGQSAQGYLIVHRRSSGAQTSGFAWGRKNRCYGFLANGSKWRAIEPWVVNAANTRGLTDTFVANALAADIAKWEDAADGIMDNALGADILGNGATTTAFLAADTTAPDGVNEAYFADILDTNAIAVTIVWYNSFTKTLLEWDQVYDDVTFDWSASGEAGKMDFDNIATHELGHAVGLADLYRGSCAEETMYGYAAEGETKKRTLNVGDITGTNLLY